MKPLADREAVAVERACALMGAVRDLSPVTVAEGLAALGRRDLEEVAIALAAMVPDERTPRSLLGWLDPISLAPRKRQPRMGANLRKAHAAYEAARKAGLLVDVELRQGERDYQRQMKRSSDRDSQRRQRSGGPTARCPRCGGTYRVQASGGLWTHRYGDGVCSGSGALALSTGDVHTDTWTASTSGVTPEPSGSLGERRTA